MDKTQVLALLDARGISYELAEHEAVFHMGALAEAGVPHLDRIAKNLLLRDDKKRAFFLVSVWGEKRLDLKAFRKAHGTRPLTFASDEDLSRLLALTPGSVTPLGLLNAAPESVRWFIDADFFSGEGIIGVHPNDNTATIFLTAADLVDLLRSEGHSVEVSAF